MAPPRLSIASIHCTATAATWTSSSRRPTGSISCRASPTSSRRMAEKVGALRPDMKVVFMSGYTDNVIVHKGVLEPGVLFINKPLLPSLLTRKIREILDNI